MENDNFKRIEPKLNILNPIGLILTVFIGIIGYIQFAQELSIIINIFIILILIIAVLIGVVIYMLKQHKSIVRSYNLLVSEYDKGQKNRKALSTLYTRSTENEDRLKAENQTLRFQLRILHKLLVADKTSSRKEIIDALELEKNEVYDLGE